MTLVVHCTEPEAPMQSSWTEPDTLTVRKGLENGMNN